MAQSEVIAYQAQPLLIRSFKVIKRKSLSLKGIFRQLSPALSRQGGPSNAKLIKDLEEDVIRKGLVAELKELAGNKELQRQIKDDAQASVGKAKKDKQAAKKQIKDDVIKRVEVQ